MRACVGVPACLRVPAGYVVGLRGRGPRSGPYSKPGLEGGSERASEHEKDRDKARQGMARERGTEREIEKREGESDRERERASREKERRRGSIPLTWRRVLKLPVDFDIFSLLRSTCLHEHRINIIISNIYIIYACINTQIHFSFSAARACTNEVGAKGRGTL